MQLIFCRCHPTPSNIIAGPAGQSPKSRPRATLRSTFAVFAHSTTGGWLGLYLEPWMWDSEDRHVFFGWRSVKPKQIEK